MSTPAGGDLVPVGIAARLAGKSKRHVWRLLASGQLPSTMIEGHRFVARSDAAKKRLTSGKKKTDINWKCQSASREAEIVENVLHELRPVVEKLVLKHLEK